MRIKKVRHSCLVVEEGGTRVMIDPGVYSPDAADEEGIEAILVTHAHPDHCDLALIRLVCEKNPNARVYGNADTVDLLRKEGIPCTLVQDGEAVEAGALSATAHEGEHAYIYEGFPRPFNTGYVINGFFFHPGDSLEGAPRGVRVLALPVMAPWSKISETMDYAKEVAPRMCFPIHDGLLAEHGPFRRLPERFLPPAGIEYRYVGAGEEFTV